MAKCEHDFQLETVAGVYLTGAHVCRRCSYRVGCHTNNSIDTQAIQGTTNLMRAWKRVLEHAPTTCRSGTANGFNYK
jgi:hypothetical protein